MIPGNVIDEAKRQGKDIIVYSDDSEKKIYIAFHYGEIVFSRTFTEQEKANGVIFSNFLEATAGNFEPE